MAPVDARDFGRLEQEVVSLKEAITVLQKDVTDLLELVNRARGALWLLFGLSTALGAVAGWISKHILGSSS